MSLRGRGRGRSGGDRSNEALVQLDLFESEHADLIADCEQRVVVFDRLPVFVTRGRLGSERGPDHAEAAKKAASSCARLNARVGGSADNL